MTLPSKYAPEGLSAYHQSKVITSGHSRQKKPTEYIIRDLESRIDRAAEKHPDHELDGDIEMIGMSDDHEVSAVSDYVSYSRNEGDFSYDDIEMEPVEEYYNQEQESEQKQLGQHQIGQVDYYGQHHQHQGQNYRTVEGNVSYLVIDTNFILSHLDVLDGLRQEAKENKLRIVVPITVMRELDGLKNSNKPTSNEKSEHLSGKSMGHLARWANDWIYTNLANNSTFIQGQKIAQRLDRETLQDDAILDCCVYFVRNNPESLVVLLSNDKNLCLKALSNDVLTVSHRTGMTSELIAKVIYDENIRRHGIREAKQVPVETLHPTISPSVVNSVISSTIEQPSESPPHTISQSVQRAPQSQSIMSFDEVSNQVYSEIQKLTLSVIHHCMETVYGEDLELLREYEKDYITSLPQCGVVFMRFWFPVFQEYFRRSGSHIKPFEEQGKNKNPYCIEVPSDSEELREFVEHWIEILEVLYSAEMDESQNQALTILASRWRGFVEAVR